MKIHDGNRKACVTRPHHHHRSEEIYHITAGKGRICLDENR